MSETRQRIQSKAARIEWKGLSQERNNVDRDESQVRRHEGKVDRLGRDPQLPVLLQRRPPAITQSPLRLLDSVPFEERLRREKDADHDGREHELIGSDPRDQFCFRHFRWSESVHEEIALSQGGKGVGGTLTRWFRRELDAFERAKPLCHDGRKNETSVPGEPCGSHKL